MGGLGSGPSLKMGGFQSCHSREKQGILELKIIKKCTFFLNDKTESAIFILRKLYFQRISFFSDYLQQLSLCRVAAPKVCPFNDVIFIFTGLLGV